MSKITLEKVLALTKPEPEQAATDFKSLFHTYTTGNGCVQKSINRMVSVNTAGYKPAEFIRQLMGSWDSIPFMMGLCHRMAADGYDPFPKLGYSREESDNISSVLAELQSRLSNVERINGTTRKTITQQIHDNIKSNHC